MADRYPHFWGGSQICTQGALSLKTTNGEKLEMLNCKFACISDPAANTMQTPVTVHVITSPVLSGVWRSLVKHCGKLDHSIFLERTRSLITMIKNHYEAYTFRIHIII